MPYKDPEKRKAHDRAYYAANAEAKRAYQNEYRTIHKIDINEKARPYSLLQHAQDPEWRMLICAKNRAKRKGLPFNLERGDIVIPAHCPYLGIALKINEGKMGKDSPTLDRIIPELGYIKGNVEVISWRANSLKKDAKPQELLSIALRMNKLQHNVQ